MKNRTITIVTGFFKINRKEWRDFGRSDEEYFEHFKVWGKIKNRLVVYVETEELKNKILEFRKSFNLEEETIVHLVPDCTALHPELYHSIKEATENKTQQLYRLLKKNPETWNGAYNYIVLLKAWCVCDAIKRGNASGMVAWVDFGYNHGGYPIDKDSDFNYTWEYDFPEKINLFLIQELDNRPLFDIVLSMDTYIMGGVVVGIDSLWEKYWSLLVESSFELNRCGLSDDEQNIILMSYRKCPEIFHTHMSNWSVQLKQFGGDHLKWAPTRKEGKFMATAKAFRRYIIKHIHCLKYAYGIYKHLLHQKIH